MDISIIDILYPIPGGLRVGPIPAVGILLLKETTRLII